MMTSRFERDLNLVLDSVQRLTALSNAMGLLGWDIETYLPPRGIEARSSVYSTLSTMHHELLTEARFVDAVEALHADAASLETPEQQALIRELHKDVEEAKKLPPEWVQAMSETTAKAQPVWKAAKDANRFEDFAPTLQRVVDLNRQYADYIGYDGSPYNALLNQYEPGLKIEVLTPLFAELQGAITTLLGQLGDQLSPARYPFKHTPEPVTVQKAFAQQLMAHIGFDMQAGRLDDAAHPFCMGLHPTDVRLTNRYFEDDFTSGFFSALHETGHGLYEQGVSPHLVPYGLADGASLAVHESQSRLWENLIGRSRVFWEPLFPALLAAFPNAMAGVDPETFHRAINTVQPSLIRVESDEVTYNLHILIRTDLERRLINGELAVKDLPQAWNDAYETTLGIRPTTDAQGCLQDVHWAHGSFGYFPTYTLGNCYSAMWIDQAEDDLPDLWTQIAAGDCLPLRNWLKKAIHQHGKLYRPADLLHQVTCKSFSVEPFIQYLQAKYLSMVSL